MTYDHAEFMRQKRAGLLDSLERARKLGDRNLVRNIELDLAAMGGPLETTSAAPMPENTDGPKALPARQLPRRSPSGVRQAQ